MVKYSKISPVIPKNVPILPTVVWLYHKGKEESIELSLVLINSWMFYIFAKQCEGTKILSPVDMLCYNYYNYYELLLQCLQAVHAGN